MLRFLYSIATYKIWCLLHIVGLFNPKIARFVKGRKKGLQNLERSIAKTDRIIWFHAASLGEFEQGLPVIEAIKNRYKAHKILLTFFSPSGYEVIKNKNLVDIVAYLPFDTPTFAKRFIDIVRPEMAIFIKYEFWPNYLYYLRKNKVKTFLLSAIFRPNQIFFKSYGGFSRAWLEAFTCIFVQDEDSKQRLENIGILPVITSGDTRFDRVSELIKRFSPLDFAENFKGNSLCVVLGSSYPEDEAFFIEHINSAPKDLKYIIVPHHTDAIRVESLKKRISAKVGLLSEQKGQELKSLQVLIIDTVGLLSRLYYYADIAYVGGGQKKNGLHNVLEAAAYGVPVFIGHYYSKFKEAEDLVRAGGITCVASKEQAVQAVNTLLADQKRRADQGKICLDYVASNTGATEAIIRSLPSV